MLAWAGIYTQGGLTDRPSEAWFMQIMLSVLSITLTWAAAHVKQQVTIVRQRGAHTGLDLVPRMPPMEVVIQPRTIDGDSRWVVRRILLLMPRQSCPLHPHPHLHPQTTCTHAISGISGHRHMHPTLTNTARIPQGITAIASCAFNSCTCIFPGTSPANSMSMNHSGDIFRFHIQELHTFSS